MRVNFNEVFGCFSLNSHDYIAINNEGHFKRFSGGWSTKIKMWWNNYHKASLEQICNCASALTGQLTSEESRKIVNVINEIKDRSSRKWENINSLFLWSVMLGKREQHDNQIKAVRSFVTNFNNSEIQSNLAQNANEFLPEDQLTLFLRYQEKSLSNIPYKDRLTMWLTNYLKLHPSSSWNLSKYETEIFKIAGLADLISTPVILYMAAEVLVYAAESCSELLPEPVRQGEQKITTLDLYRAFIEIWFVRAEGQLMRDHRLADFSGDIKLNFESYCTKLASKMYRDRITLIDYDASVQNEWTEFFGDQGRVSLIRSGAPLKKIGNRYAFIDISIQEYFTTKEMLNAFGTE